jgi:hypothetical protein
LEFARPLILLARPPLLTSLARGALVLVLPSIEAIRSAFVDRLPARRLVFIGALTLGTIACSVYEPGLLPQAVGVTSGGGGGGIGGIGGAKVDGGAVTNAPAGGEPSAGEASEGGVGPATGGAPSAGASGTSSGGSGSASSGGCAGVVYEEMCWYLGERGQSCDATCGTHGAVDARGASVVGTTAQGGSLDGCSQVLETLGMSVAPTAAIRKDVGLGCHLYDAEAFWLDEPSFTSDASQVSSRIVCACRH